MWDWYNRPGRRGVPRTRSVLLIMVCSGLLIGAFFFLLYSVLAPYVFVRVPG